MADADERQKDRCDAFGVRLPTADQTAVARPACSDGASGIAYRDVRRFTYVELRDRVSELASALDKVGVRPGDSVAANDPAAGSRVFDESRCVSGRIESQWLIAPKPVNPNRIRFSDRAAPT
jgi:acyl-CoA synthetase (AMP-forming)/AMP-acid ligase II